MQPVSVSQPDHKYCPTCKTEKPFSEFYALNGKRRRLAGECKPCSRNRGKRLAYWKNITPETRRKKYLRWRSKPENVEKDRQYARSYLRRTLYKITPEQYDNLIERQKGVCAICENPPKSSSDKDRILNVDHDHVTGRVRGLLCFHCNNGLGKFRDSPVLLAKASEYLKQ